MAPQFEIALLIRNTTHFVTWRIRQVTDVFKFVTLQTSSRFLLCFNLLEVIPMNTEIGQESRQIAFYEGELLVKSLESKEEFRQAYHLRHRVFAEKLRWVDRKSVV